MGLGVLVVDFGYRLGFSKGGFCELLVGSCFDVYSFMVVLGEIFSGEVVGSCVLR